MKRLLALIVVLCLASSAGEALQISVNGNKNPIDSEFTAFVSDHLELGIWTDEVIGMFEYQTWMLVCNTFYGDISGGQSVHPWMTMYGPTENHPGVVPPPGEEGIWGQVFNLDPSLIPAGTVLADSIDYHQVGIADCVVSLYEVIEYQPASVLLDRVIIRCGSIPYCMDNDGSQEYQTWIAAGEPRCWCYCRQCRGDIDGLQQYGTYWVFTDDLDIFKANFAKNPVTNICADLDHKEQFGIYRVFTDDLNIFKWYFAKSSGSVPPCDQPDPANPAYPGIVYTGPYNFWCDPVTGLPVSCQ